MSKKPSIHRPISKAGQLGDFVLSAYQFEGLSETLKKLKNSEYKKFNHKLKSERVNQALLEMIQSAPEGSFLLMAVVGFLDEVARQKVLINYNLTSFEIWLNQFSGLSQEDNLKVRAKIVGKWVPRDAYQLLFPVGMGKYHPGSHFVTAHASPDLDTTIASFWGWVDAFGARVAEGTHVWNVPGGAPGSSIEVALLFHHIFGQNVFEHLAKTRGSLALSSLELMTQKGVIKQQTDKSSVGVDHERTQRAIILVDDEGYFLGDWRNFDVEGVRQVILLLNNCLRWFENHLHIELISLFAEEHLKSKDLPPFVKGVFGAKIKSSQPASEFSEKQQRLMEGYLRKVLGVEKGMEATFAEFAEAMKALGLTDFTSSLDHIAKLEKSDLFDKQEDLIEDRPKIFHHLEEIIAQLDRAIQSVRLYTERFKVALDIKTNVFGYLPQVVSYRADIDELKSKMGNYPYLTVTSADEEGRMIPLGVVRSRDLHQPILGTVTLRDFCNRDETKIPSYFEVISVIDHHKCSLQTQGAPVAYISDAQSSNTMVAELAFAINDRYSTGGMEKKEIEAQIQKVQKDLSKPENNRIMRRLLSRLQATQNPYLVDPLREFVEYLHFLYAILDDTDLLTKVSRRDVVVVASILNRLKSLMEGEEVEIISFDDLKQDETFVHRAAVRILRHKDMYSLYRKIYMAKEQLVEENLALCSSGKESSIFVDTKLQNGCARVGQTKMFANNFPAFQSHADALRKKWLQESKSFFAGRREYDLYMQMVSTVAGAEDLYSGSDGEYTHKDELWIWIPRTEQSIEHLKTFLNEFRASSQITEHESEVEVEFQGAAANELAMVFAESFSLNPHQIVENKGKGESFAIIRFPAGIINSRKAMISPYLPEPVG
ncbi:MAG: hypothetical protein P0S96_01730 [Simkaniaceae bacterium]|nr:hypothetical protein [Candidatus Sacchlamyda saccharinae]